MSPTAWLHIKIIYVLLEIAPAFCEAGAAGGPAGGAVIYRTLLPVVAVEVNSSWIGKFTVGAVELSKQLDVRKIDDEFMPAGLTYTIVMRRF